MSIEKYIYRGTDDLYLDINQLYVVTVTHPGTQSVRRFIAEFDDKIWDLSKKDCLYAGNIQGGRLGDIKDPVAEDSVIEGSYRQYIVNGLFDNEFEYQHFETECN